MCFDLRFGDKFDYQMRPSMRHADESDWRDGGGGRNAAVWAEGFEEGGGEADPGGGVWVGAAGRVHGVPDLFGGVFGWGEDKSFTEMPSLFSCQVCGHVVGVSFVVPHVPAVGGGGGGGEWRERK